MWKSGERTSPSNCPSLVITNTVCKTQQHMIIKELSIFCTDHSAMHSYLHGVSWIHLERSLLQSTPMVFPADFASSCISCRQHSNQFHTPRRFRFHVFYLENIVVSEHRPGPGKIYKSRSSFEKRVTAPAQWHIYISFILLRSVSRMKRFELQ